jgi:hypothetical protein
MSEKKEDNATSRQDATSGGVAMTKSIMWLLIALFFAVPLGAGVAQTINRDGTAPLQSIITSPRSACGLGSQSVRVCNNDFQSCNSACSAASAGGAASLEGCAQRCCNNFRACLSIRGCANLTATDCFSPLSPEVRALRGAAE